MTNSEVNALVSPGTNQPKLVFRYMLRSVFVRSNHRHFFWLNWYFFPFLPGVSLPSRTCMDKIAEHHTKFHCKEIVYPLRSLNLPFNLFISFNILESQNILSNIQPRYAIWCCFTIIPLYFMLSLEAILALLNFRSNQKGFILHKVWQKV